MRIFSSSHILAIMPRGHALNCTCVHCGIWRNTLGSTHWVEGRSVSVYINSNHKSRALNGEKPSAWLSASDPLHGEPSLPIEKIYIGLFFSCASVPATYPHVTLAYNLVIPCTIGGKRCESVAEVRDCVDAFVHTLLFANYFYSLYLTHFGDGWGYLVQQSPECAFYCYLALPLHRFLHGPMYDDSFGLNLIRYSHITPDYKLDDE